MSALAGISGTYSDLKLVKTRSVVQIVVEVPIEQAEAVVRAFGIPQPGKEIPVALARLSERPAEPKPKKGSLAQRAAILCGDPVYQRFLSEQFRNLHVSNPDAAATVTRDMCKVKSRAEFDTDPEAAKRWDAVWGAFQAWKLAA